MNKFVLRQAQDLQAKLLKAKDELADMTTEVSSGGGAIKIVIDGQQRVRSVSISPEVINGEDIEMLQDLVMTAVNEAIQKSQDMAANHLSSLTGGLKIPGMF
jgi:DNA-binding YbaB/EbfC family protein